MMYFIGQTVRVKEGVRTGQLGIVRSADGADYIVDFNGVRVWYLERELEAV